MCGICGSFGYNHGTVLAAMESLHHRGPDGGGSLADDICILGHQRLAIIDLSSNGRQPMANENNTIFMVVNGEIYNYLELRGRLQGKHLFRSHSDSEVIVHAYEEYGDGFVTKLRGMFALALYDKNRKRLLLVRDPIGKKPLYYATTGDRLLFASEEKGILAMGYPAKVNYNAIPSYLMYQHVLGTETLLNGVKMLPAGHTLATQIGSAPTVTPYWTISSETTISDKEAIALLRDRLNESVILRLRADVPIGSFLSGGMDSSAVTALYRKHYSGKLHTFTATFPGHSEADYAKEVSQYLNTEYHEVLITPEAVAADIEKITWHHDDPLGDAATINNYYLSKEAKKHVTVVLAGEGGDEVFGGYPYHRYIPYIRAMNAVPAILRRAGQNILSRAGVGDLSGVKYGYGRVLLFPCQPDLDSMLLYPTTATSELTVRWLLSKQYGEQYTVTPHLPSNGHGTYNRLLTMDCLNLLQKFLMKADKATMAFAVEERLPLLDREVIATAFSTSPEMRRNKYILRKAVEDLLPPSIIWRPKQGFGTPIDSWLKNDRLGEMVEDRITSGELLKEICQPGALRKVIGCLAKAKKAKGVMSLKPTNVIWSLFALQVWHDVWFGGRVE